jgi:hypothetical protein
MTYSFSRISCLAYFVLSLSLVCSAQENKKNSFSLKLGGGNSIATRSFFTDGPNQNIPHSAFLHIIVSADIRQEENKSYFLGLEIQALDFYPSYDQKNALSSASIMVGKSRKIDLSNSFYFKQTNGVVLNSLLDVSSFQPEVSIYSGGPFNNLNFGVFSSLLVLLSKGYRQNTNLEYGLGIDFAFRGIQVYTNKNFPAYLRQNPFIQYGMNLNVGYKF